MRALIFAATDPRSAPAPRRRAVAADETTRRILGKFSRRNSRPSGPSVSQPRGAATELLFRLRSFLRGAARRGGAFRFPCGGVVPSPRTNYVVVFDSVSIGPWAAPLSTATNGDILAEIHARGVQPKLVRYFVRLSASSRSDSVRSDARRLSNSRRNLSTLDSMTRATPDARRLQPAAGGRYSAPFRYRCMRMRKRSPSFRFLHPVAAPPSPPPANVKWPSQLRIAFVSRPPSSHFVLRSSFQPNSEAPAVIFFLFFSNKFVADFFFVTKEARPPICKR